MIINKNNQPEKDSEFALEVFHLANNIVTPILRDFEKVLLKENPEAHILKKQYRQEDGHYAYIFTRSDTGEGICAVRYTKNHQPILYL